jgi:thioredoxin reductase
LEPERIEGMDIVVVGGGDSAVESAFLLMDQNNVILSYRKDKFARIKPNNRDRLEEAIHAGKLNVMTNSEITQISEHFVTFKIADEVDTKRVSNDLVYIFAGGELPTNFLKSAGVEITKRFGYIMKSHKSNR